jgi:hypothetical protein
MKRNVAPWIPTRRGDGIFCEAVTVDSISERVGSTPESNLLLLGYLVKGFPPRGQNLAVDQAKLIDDEGNQAAVTHGLTPVEEIERPVRLPESATIVAEHGSIDKGDCPEILIARRKVVSPVDVRADAPCHIPASMTAIFLHLLTLLVMGTFSTRM